MAKGSPWQIKRTFRCVLDVFSFEKFRPKVLLDQSLVAQIKVKAARLRPKVKLALKLKKGRMMTVYECGLACM
jgi:hypothetical protein